jgi:zinc-binding in reverse transcriptase
MTGTTVQWHQFWTQNIPHKARSLWWRLLLRKLPVAKYRHEVWKHDSPLCHDCGEVETIEHAYVECLTKGFAWRDFLALYTDVRAWRDADIFSLVTFDPVDFNILPNINITKAQVIACGLLGIKASIDMYYLTEHSLSTTAIFKIMASQAATLIKENSLGIY